MNVRSMVISWYVSTFLFGHGIEIDRPLYIFISIIYIDMSLLSHLLQLEVFMKFYFPNKIVNNSVDKQLLNSCFASQSQFIALKHIQLIIY